ncbi:MAG: hypothetical protein ACI4UK_03990 [Floccifex sp.]
MLNEFKKINNIRQQRKYLDKLALQIRKTEMTDQLAQEILELDLYLSENGYYKLYDGMFEDVVENTKLFYLEKEIQNQEDQLNISQKQKLESFCEFAFDQDKVTELVIGNESFCIQSKNLPDLDVLKKSRVQAKYAILQAIQKNESIQLKKGRRTIKKI